MPDSNLPVDVLSQIIGEQEALKAKQKLDQNKNIYNIFERLATSVTNAEPLRTRHAYIQLAANQAWHHHCGKFYSDTLENKVLEISDEIKIPPVINTRFNLNSTCHILTRAKSIGGHTKLISNWINAHKNICHNVVITRQMGEPIPLYLVKTVRDNGGVIIDLQKEYSNWEKRIALLVQFIEQSIAIILHTHPYDVLALIAVSISKSCPPVAYMNHADHVFWLGKNSADIYINFRNTGIDLSTSRRDILSSSCRLLPIPINTVISDKIEKKEARKKLGLSSSKVIALTIASEYKMFPIGNVNFLMHHASLASKYSDYVHIIIGHNGNENSDKAVELSKGKLIILPPSPQIILYFLASDFYVDSYPLSSITSYLEAASYGLPIIGFDPWQGNGSVIGSPEPCLNNLDYQFKFDNQDKYEREFERLVYKNIEREELGRAIMGIVEENYSEQIWKDNLDKLWSSLLCSNKGNNVSKVNQKRDSNKTTLIDYILVLIGNSSDHKSHDTDILLTDLRYKDKIKLRQKIKFGLAGWLPETLFRKSISIKNRIKF